MDRAKPLWDICVVEGLRGGRGALIPRVHHSLIDGVGGVALMKVLFDLSAEASQRTGEGRKQPRLRPARQPSLAQGVISGIRSSLAHLIGIEEGIIAIAKGWFNDREMVANAALLIPELLSAFERLPFNKPCTGERSFSWVELDLAEVQAARAAVGASLNDLVLSVVTRAVARYVQLHGQTVDGRLIRMVCPVNTRPRDQGEVMGNQITFRPVVLPLDIKDPVKMLQATALRTFLMKKARAADLVSLAARSIGVAPPPLQKLLWRGIANVILPLPLFHMICTNMPGSPVPLYCGGRKMLACYPQVPTGYELGVNCAVLSYNGKVFFGLIAAPNVVPDVTRLRDFLHQSFEELVRATGVRKTARAGRRPARPKPRTIRQARPKPKPSAEAIAEVATEPLPGPAALNAMAGG